MTRQEFDLVTQLVALARRPLDTGSFDRAGIAQAMRLMRKRGLTAAQAVQVVDRLAGDRDQLPVWDVRPELPGVSDAQRMRRFAWARFGLGKQAILRRLREGAVYTALHADFDVTGREDMYRLERIQLCGRRYEIAVQMVARRGGRWVKIGAPKTQEILAESIIRAAPILYTVRERA